MHKGGTNKQQTTNSKQKTNKQTNKQTNKKTGLFVI
jgi:hypothetical protein